MTLTLELPLDAERALEAEAEQQGMAPADFAVRMLVSHLASSDALLQHPGRVNRAPDAGKDDKRFQQGATQLAIEARLATWEAVGSYDTRATAGLEPLPDAAMERESIYEGRGL
jgi:hypothetical protein